MAGGGVGEAALMGAVLGGGASALQGGDPLKGALMGGALGAGGAALMPEAAAAAGATEAGAAGAGANAGIVGSTDVAANIAANPALYPAGSTAPNMATMLTPQGTAYAIPSAGSNVAAAAAPAQSGIASLMPTTTAGKVALGSAGLLGASMISDRNRYGVPEREKYNGPLSRFTYDPSTYQPVEVRPPSPLYQAQYAAGGTVEQMSNANAIGMNTGYPQADITGHAYSTPWQTPLSQNVVQGSADTGVNRMDDRMLAGGGTVNLQGTIDLGGGGGGPQGANGYQAAGSGGMMGGGFDPRAIASNPQGFQQYLSDAQYREQSMPGSTFLSQMGQLGGAGISGLMGYAAGGGISSLGKYSDGGRMLKGPGDGMSDSIPATISDKQPARLADGEFVVPADVVSHLGNGSTDAGARQLYKMMDKVRTARTGRKAQGREINPKRYMPA